MSTSKLIPISEQHWEELGDIKGAGESWDDVVGDLIEQYKKARRRLGCSMRSAKHGRTPSATLPKSVKHISN